MAQAFEMPLRIQFGDDLRRASCCKISSHVVLICWSVVATAPISENYLSWVMEMLGRSMSLSRRRGWRYGLIEMAAGSHA